MGSRFRSTFLVAVVATVLGATAVAVELIGSTGQAISHFTGWATIAAVPLTLLSALLALRRSSFTASTAPEMDAGEAEGLLGVALERESHILAFAGR